MDDVRSVELTITSHTGNLPVVRAAVERLARLEGLVAEESHAVMLAIDEALANVIKHGYDGRPNEPIKLTLEPVRSVDGRRGVAVTVRDRGRQVDPATIRGRDLSDIRPGGLGVHIIRSVMDEVEYSCPPEGGMQLRMVKFAAPTAAAPGCE